MKNDSRVEFVERGCSTFGVDDGIKLGRDCYDADGMNINSGGEQLEPEIDVCKDYCIGNNCNNNLPQLPNNQIDCP